MLIEEIKNLITESRDENTRFIDRKSTEEILTIINEHEQTVAEKVKNEIPAITKVVDKIVNAFRNGGRLFYIGAGTSGRIGVLDASECPPTFGTDPSMVQAIIAGGNDALLKAIEGAEDNEELGCKEIAERGIRNKDVVIGIAASGRTPYVIGALKEAKRCGAATIAFACNKQAKINDYSDMHINVEVGPEVITGSTRMKAGTAQKLVLNMITTTSMIKLGKIYENLMVDVQASNKKLIDRAKRIIMDATDCSWVEADQLFNKANGNLKAAIVMHNCNCDQGTAENRLKKANGFVYKAIMMDDFMRGEKNNTSES